MLIGVVGINHKLAPLKLREQLAAICQRRFTPGASLHREIDYILISTCNRTEIYFHSFDLAASHSYILQILRREIEIEEFDQKLYSYFGSDCFRHLGRVAAGLDSAIVAETEIQGQVKNAYEEACHAVKVPYELHYIFQKALRIGKMVRSHLPIPSQLPHLEHAIHEAGISFFGTLIPKILFIGASSINQKVIRFLLSRGFTSLTLCNRTPLSEKFSYLKSLPWNSLHHWVNFDWIICGTKAQHHLLTLKDLENTPENALKLILDLSVPSNVSSEVGLHSQITLKNIDALMSSLKDRRPLLLEALSHSEQLVEAQIKRYYHSFITKNFKIAPNEFLSLV